MEILYKNLENEEFGELFLDDAGVLKQEIQDYKLSSIQRRILDDDIVIESVVNNFSIELFEAILNRGFEFGMEIEADKVFNDYHNKYGVLATNWLIKLFISHILDSKIVLGILIIISRQKLSDIGYQGQMIAISSTYSFKDDIQIQEAVIRCIENWECYELVEILEQLHPNQEWLIEYKNSVIEYLRSNAFLHQKNR